MRLEELIRNGAKIKCDKISCKEYGRHHKCYQDIIPCRRAYGYIKNNGKAKYNVK